MTSSSRNTTQISIRLTDKEHEALAAMAEQYPGQSRNQLIKAAVLAFQQTRDEASTRESDSSAPTSKPETETDAISPAEATSKPAPVSLSQASDTYLGTPWHVRVLTLPFVATTGGFDDSALQAFLVNKSLLRIEPQFFQQSGQSYWSVWIEYRPLLSPRERQGGGEVKLSAAQQTLLYQLKDWRREEADRAGIPPYVIATNHQLEAVTEPA